MATMPDDIISDREEDSVSGSTFPIQQLSHVLAVGIALGGEGAAHGEGLERLDRLEEPLIRMALGVS
jgi:hypothetical protein